ncbi:hypothetical protein HF521_016234 [Silurus meridionalis]|uniref:Uncharacterized protein n=1 Tax=Silurus meridionalis TaxID=175797 RepID=A0A8T0BQU1_SILME|nr:hypothetical protein HF521_016234 [Silurus meridionalis]
MFHIVDKACIANEVETERLPPTPCIIVCFPTNVVMQEAQGLGDEATVLPLLEGKQPIAKRSWATEECAAVKRHLRRFLVMNEVPGKKKTIRSALLQNLKPLEAETGKR